MLGAIIGDMVGSPYEFHPWQGAAEAFPLFSPRSRFTDDTVMTVAVARGLMQAYGQEQACREAFIDAMHEYGRAYSRAGYGQRFFRWIVTGSRAPYNSFGNGSAMRVSPVGWACDSLEETERYAALSASVTHDHPEGIKGACATAAAIFLARDGPGGMPSVTMSLPATGMIWPAAWPRSGPRTVIRRAVRSPSPKPSSPFWKAVPSRRPYAMPSGWAVTATRRPPSPGA